MRVRRYGSLLKAYTGKQRSGAGYQQASGASAITLWHHVGRKYFKEIIVNQGRDVGMGMETIARLIEADATYGLLHRFLYGHKAKPCVQIVDEKGGKLLIDGIPVTVLREQRNPLNIPWRQYGADVVVDCSGSFKDPTVPADDKKGSIRGHLNGGAKVVIHSAPFKIKNKSLETPEDTTTLIYGINHTAFNPKKHPSRPLPAPRRGWHTW